MCVCVYLRGGEGEGLVGHGVEHVHEGHLPHRARKKPLLCTRTHTHARTRARTHARTHQLRKQSLTAMAVTDTAVAATDTNIAVTDTGVAVTDTGVAVTDTGVAASVAAIAVIVRDIAQRRRRRVD